MADLLGAWITMMLGSIPQQDVFQRITSAKSQKIALWGSILGASIYFCFTFVPMFIAYSATLIDPALFSGLMETDSQLVLPTLVLQHTPVFAQAIFFGAVLSAIMSCSSATLLAPVAFSENIVRGLYPQMGDHQFLRLMRSPSSVLPASSSALRCIPMPAFSRWSRTPTRSRWPAPSYLCFWGVLEAGDHAGRLGRHFRRPVSVDTGRMPGQRRGSPRGRPITPTHSSVLAKPFHRN
jgi:hypothetical protein